jgi:hypothetical protein
MRQTPGRSATVLLASAKRIAAQAEQREQNMAQHKGTPRIFEMRLAELRAKYGKSKAFEVRLSKAGLV